jgi:hypothetical protein
VKPLGLDGEGNVYYFLGCNKDCKIYKELNSKDVELVIKNYEDVEKFLNRFENSKNSDEIILVKNVKEILLQLKENDDEEKKKEAIFLRKQQAFDKAKKLNNTKTQDVEKYQNSDYFLMNISDHVITRNQLNQITKVNLSQPENLKKQQVTEEDKKRQKIERERLEREKRLEKRTRNFERRVEREVYNNSLEARKRDALRKKKKMRRGRSKFNLI